MERREICPAIAAAPTTPSLQYSIGPFMSVPSPPYLAVRPETGFGRAAVAERSFELFEKPEQHRRGEGAAGGHHNPLPDRNPSQHRRVTAGEQQQQRQHRRQRARSQSEHQLRKQLIAQDQLALAVNENPARNNAGTLIPSGFADNESNINPPNTATSDTVVMPVLRLA